MIGHPNWIYKLERSGEVMPAKPQEQNNHGRAKRGASNHRAGGTRNNITLHWMR